MEIEIKRYGGVVLCMNGCNVLGLSNWERYNIEFVPDFIREKMALLDLVDDGAYILGVGWKDTYLETGNVRYYLKVNNRELKKHCPILDIKQS